MEPNLKSKLLKIRPESATWQCTVRRAPIWITPKKGPAYRPFILMVLDQGADQILKTEIMRERPNPQVVLDHLFKSMQGTLLTLLKKHRPVCISMDDGALVQACAPQLAELAIRCELRDSLPEIEYALFELEIQSNNREPKLGMLGIQGVTVPLVAELYAAAAEYYRQAPWDWIENWIPIKVRYPADGPMRYALVLGGGGEFFGLSLYSSLVDIEVILEQRPPAGPITWVSLILEEATLMEYKDLDAIERYDWPVAGKKAFPVVLKTTDDDITHPPTASDIAFLAATLRVLPSFLRQQMRAGRGRPRPSHAILSLPDVHGNQQIELRYPANPAPKAQPVTQTEAPELEAYIADWYGDDKSHEFARELGRFLFEFLDFLDESSPSEQTMRKHESNCWCIGRLECDYGYHDTFSPTIFLGGPHFDIEFKRKVSDSKNAISSYQATWRKLEKYIRSQGYDMEP